GRPRRPSGEVDKTVSTGRPRRSPGGCGSKEETSYRQGSLTASAVMTILFGTLGWRPQSLLPSIRSTENLERVGFYHSDHAKSRDARSKVMDFCPSLGLTASAVEVSDAYDLLHVAGHIRAGFRMDH